MTVLLHMAEDCAIFIIIFGSVHELVLRESIKKLKPKAILFTSSERWRYKNARKSLVDESLD